MGTLSPVAPGQTPTLGPFGSPTRVAPPPTGSFTPTSAPINQSTSGPMNPPASGFGPPSTQPQASLNQSPIGSAVQSVGWTETNAALPQANSNSDARYASAGTTASPRMTDPRSGGMGVIDLTGAPNPPGYMPNNYFPPVSSVQGNQAYQGYQDYPVANQPSFQPMNSAQPYPSFQNNSPPGSPQPNEVPQTMPVLRSLPPTPDAIPMDAGRIASNEWSSGLPSTDPPSGGNAISNGRSTTAPSTQPSSDLQWRRPGTHY